MIHEVSEKYSHHLKIVANYVHNEFHREAFLLTDYPLGKMSTNKKTKTKFVTIQILMGFMAHDISKQRKIKLFSKQQAKLLNSTKTPSQLTFDTHIIDTKENFYTYVKYVDTLRACSLFYIVAAHYRCNLNTMYKIGGRVVHSKWNKVVMTSFYFICVLKDFPSTNKMLSKNVSCSSALQYKI